MIMLRKTLSRLSCFLGIHNWIVHRREYRFTDISGDGLQLIEYRGVFGLKIFQTALAVSIMSVLITLSAMIAALITLDVDPNATRVLEFCEGVILPELLGLGILLSTFFFEWRFDRSCLRCGRQDFELSDYEKKKSRVEREYEIHTGINT